MAKSTASTPDEYLSELPPERAEELATVRRLVLEHLPEGFEEQMSFGMIGWVVPLDRYPDTYNGQPLMYAALAANKNNFALHLPCLYVDEERTARFQEAFAASGHKLDMGKGCVRFKRADDLALDVVAAEIAATDVDAYLASYERART